MTPDVTAEAGLYSGAGDPISWGAGPVSRDGWIRLFTSRFWRNSRLQSTGLRPGHFSGLARRSRSSFVRAKRTAHVVPVSRRRILFRPNEIGLMWQLIP